MIRSAACLFLVTLPLAAAAQEPCPPYAEVARVLREEYHEQPIGRGITGEGDMMVEVWASGMGTWTVVVTTPDGRACVPAGGVDWEVFTDPPIVPGQDR